MSESNFDHSDGNWDEQSKGSDDLDGIGWSEFQWRKYLQGSDRDTARFLSFYNSVKDKPNHLDEVAVLMGWDAEDISLTNDLTTIELEEEIVSPEGNGGEPYTLHRHPVYVVTRALYRYLQQSWEHYMAHDQSQLSAQFCWKYSNSLHQGEMNVLLSIQALDLGDFGLTICHLKNSLSALNQSMALINQLDHANQKFLEAFQHEIRIRLFDLRELWIRVITDCRNDARRLQDEDDEI